MKKTILIAVLVVLALGVFTSGAAAQASQPATCTLHDYLEEALAGKLGIPVATVEAQFDAGKTLYQIALDNGIAQADISAFMAAVRTDAVNAALADGVITQAQADRMLRMSARGLGAGMGAGQGYGMMGGAGAGTGVGLCGGTGIPVGNGMQRGGRWQQVNP